MKFTLDGERESEKIQKRLKLDCCRRTDADGLCTVESENALLEEGARRIGVIIAAKLCIVHPKLRAYF